jgi:hypothetical protein
MLDKARSGESELASTRRKKAYSLIQIRDSNCPQEVIRFCLTTKLTFALLFLSQRARPRRKAEQGRW